MAVGNIIQGTARGRLGDTVLWRQNGQQHSRLRIRNPYNPNTNAQKYQRAVVATVMQAYSAGKEIFDHSNEGLAVGSQNMRYFLQRNIKKLRSLLAQELNGNVAPSLTNGRFVAPKSITPVGFHGMQVSHGSYQPKWQWITAGMLDIQCPVSETEVTPCSYYAEVLGLVADDYYTLVGFVYEPDVVEYQVADDNYAKQFAASFYYVRLRVLPDLLNSDADLSTKSISDFFELDSWKGNIDPSALMEQPANMGQKQFNVVLGVDDKITDMAVIRSRRDMDLRSTSYLNFGVVNHEYGLTYNNILQAWNNIESNIDDPEVILEGGSNQSF